jgi:hypothetical protein
MSPLQKKLRELETRTNPELEEAIRTWRTGVTVEERVAAFRYLKTQRGFAAHQLGVAFWAYATVRTDHALIDASLVALGEDTIRLACWTFDSTVTLPGELEGVVQFIEAHPARGWAELLPILQRRRRQSLLPKERRRWQDALERIAHALRPTETLPIPASLTQSTLNLPIPLESEQFL